MVICKNYRTEKPERKMMPKELRLEKFDGSQPMKSNACTIKFNPVGL